MRLSNRTVHWIVALLLVALGASYLNAISRKTLTNDELVHIPAGYYYWKFGAYELNSEHPPLIKMWAALPLLLLPQFETEPPRNSSVAERFTFFGGFWQARVKDFNRVAFLPRAMMVVFPILLGFLIFLFARKLFGTVAGLCALVLFCVEPTVLAHGRVVHTDIPGALAYFGFFFQLHRYWHKRDLKNTLLLGLITALALLTKFSMIVLVPIVGVVFLAAMFWWRSEWRRLGFALVGVAGIVLLLLNVVYRFQHPGLSAIDRAIIAGQSPYADGMAALVPALSLLLPTYFPFGLYIVMAHNGYGHAASLLGMQGVRGWWYYFPVAFALKTSLPILLAVVAALFWATYDVLVRRSPNFLWLLLPAGFYLGTAMTSHINIGIRHVLPVFPFLFVLAGAFLAHLMERWRKAGVTVAVLLMIWATAEAARVFPDYTAYTNELARGPAWQYLSDSNVEWGDDATDLAVFLKARGISRIRGALVGGGTTLVYMGIDCGNLLGIPGPETDYVALGASLLNGSTVPFGGPGSGRETDEQRINFFAKYRDMTPEATFGGSIYLYRVR